MLFLAGLGAYGSLPRAEDPGFKIRTVVVTTFLPGATPERVELLVTDRLEKAIEEIPEVDYVTSQSRTGASVIEVNFGEKYLDLEPLFSDLRDKIDNVRSDLPAEVIGPQINDDFDDVFGTVLALTGDGFDRVELERGAEQIRNRLLDLDDVAKVDLIGTQEQRVFIEYDESRLAEAGVTPLQMANILQARNILDPSGDVRSERERFILDVQGSFDSVSAIRDTVIRLPSGALTAIGDLAEVRRGTVDPPVVSATYSGEPAVIMAVAMREEGNITELGPEVLQKVDRLIQEYPIGLDVHLVSYQTTQVNKSVDNFVASLMQGIGVVLVVMLLTLGLRTGLIVAAIIPMTMVGSLVFMQFFDITINQMSLAALIISLGLLVDSGIVMAESIVVSIREGRSPIAAALDS
ncbi:MAG: efflux RND transporter permease subunit, partial [Acidobacteriota bacterium]